MIYEMIRRVSPKEYGNLFPEPSHVFDSVAFNELNREKCDGIHYLVMSDAGGKVRFGLILGERGAENGDRNSSPRSPRIRPKRTLPPASDMTR